MEKRSQYTIQFASLPAGVHSYDFHIGDDFFRGYEHSLISSADVRIHLDLEKGVSNLQLAFNFDGTIHTACVRCLEEFDIQIDNEQRHLVVRQLEAVDETVEEEEDVIAIPLTAHELDLAPHIYDYLSLMVPLNPVHPDKEDGTMGCDQKVLDEMNQHLEHDPQHDDPRWDMLKKLKK